MRRFYAPKENIDFRRSADGSSARVNKITLDSDETRHLRDVLRLKESDSIQVFDGENSEYLCRIEKIGKRETVLEIVEKIEPSAPRSNLDLTLAVAVLKGDKFDLTIQKSVELGVTRFIPLITKRCDVKLKNADKKSERWKKIIIESAKQCGRADLMKISEPLEFEKFISLTDGAKILFAENGGESFNKIKKTEKITAAVGSEGGWEQSEIELAQKKDFQIITFGGRILRAETAVISVASILQHRFGDLK